MKVLIALTLVFFFLTSHAQDTLNKRKDPFKFCLNTPNVTYNIQLGQAEELQTCTNKYFVKNKTRMLGYEFATPYLLFFEQFRIGAQLYYCPGTARKGLETQINEENPYSHINNFHNERLNIFVPRLFIGYQFEYFSAAKKRHGLVFQAYWNFDNYDYGNYSYDAKNTSNNQFHTYYLNTSTKPKQSVSFELCKYRLHEPKGASLSNWNIGFKFAVTYRNQSITIDEFTNDVLNNQQTSSSQTCNFKFWTYSMGFVFTIVDF